MPGTLLAISFKWPYHVYSGSWTVTNVRKGGSFIRPVKGMANSRRMHV